MRCCTEADRSRSGLACCGPHRLIQAVKYGDRVEFIHRHLFNVSSTRPRIFLPKHPARGKRKRFLGILRLRVSRGLSNFFRRFAPVRSQSMAIRIICSPHSPLVYTARRARSSGRGAANGIRHFEPTTGWREGECLGRAIRVTPEEPGSGKVGLLEPRHTRTSCHYRSSVVASGLSVPSGLGVSKKRSGRKPKVRFPDQPGGIAEC